VLLKSLKTKKYRGEPKTFSKRKVKVRKTNTVEVGEILELCSCPWKLCESWITEKNSTKIITPLYKSIVS
jgi:hypothetical protein